MEQPKRPTRKQWLALAIVTLFTVMLAAFLIWLITGFGEIGPRASTTVLRGNMMDDLAGGDGRVRSDGWGTPFEIRLAMPANTAGDATAPVEVLRMEVRSAGPDRKSGTPDDLVVLYALQQSGEELQFVPIRWEGVLQDQPLGGTHYVRRRLE